MADSNWTEAHRDALANIERIERDHSEALQIDADCNLARSPTDAERCKGLTEQVGRDHSEALQLDAAREINILTDAALQEFHSEALQIDAAPGGERYDALPRTPVEETEREQGEARAELTEAHLDALQVDADRAVERIALGFDAAPLPGPAIDADAYRKYRDAQGEAERNYRASPGPNDAALTEALVDWRKDPEEWFRLNCSTIDDAAESLPRLISEVDFEGSIGAAVSEEMGRVAAVLAIVQNAHHYKVRYLTEFRFFSFGPIVVPASPAGLKVLRLMRDHAEASIVGQTMETIASSNGPTELSELSNALRSALQHSAIFTGGMNRTAESGEGFDFRLQLDSRAMGSLPNGKTLPRPVISPELVGRSVEDPERIMSEESWCSEGTIEFLQEFGIQFETEGGSYECDSCGSEQGDENEQVTCIDSFELTEEMVDALERSGHLDAVKAHLDDSETSAESWETLLQEKTDSEILAENAPPDPDATAGIRFDSTVWDFVPDFESVEGIEELDDRADQIRAIVLMAEVVRTHVAAGFLPPVQGELQLREAYPGSARTGHSGFVWDPTDGTLRHGLGIHEGKTLYLQGLVLRDEAHLGRLLLSFGGKRVDLTPAGSEWKMGIPPHAAGTSAQLNLNILQGSAKL